MKIDEEDFDSAVELLRERGQEVEVMRFGDTHGRAAYVKIHEILREIEREWIAELGPKHFTQLKGLLLRVWESPLIR